MAAQLGLNVKIMLDDAVICSGITGKKIKYNGEPIDITADDGAGLRELLSQSATRSIDISVEGIAKSAAIKSLILDDTRLVDGVYVLFETGERIQSAFYISGYSEEFLTADVVKCSFDLLSSGSAQLVPAWWQYVVLALRFDGLNGSTTFTDYSPAHKTPMVSAGCSISTAQARFGGSSLYSTNGARLEYSLADDMLFLPSYTLAFWVRIPADGPQYSHMFHRMVSGYIGIDRREADAQLNITNMGTYGGGGVVVPYDTWVFITVAEDGVWRYISAAGVVHVTNIGSAQNDGSVGLSVANYAGREDLHAVTAYLDDVVFVNGYCVPDFTDDFTPPTRSLIPS